VGFIKETMALPVVDFPQPDSPTIPKVSPSYTEKEIPSTAFTGFLCFFVMHNIPLGRKP